MRSSFLRIITLTLIFVLHATAADHETGTFSFLILKEGKPLSNAEVIIDQSNTSLYTDKDGYIGQELPVGEHSLQVIGREKGQAIVFARKPFTIVADRNTQVILTLEATGDIGLSDIETPEAAEAVLDAEALKAIPKGNLALTLLASEDQQPIKGARIFVKGTTIEGRTDETGTLNLELPEGRHTISIIHGQFSSQTLNDIEITASKTTQRDVEMTPAALELEEFIVLIPNIEGSIASTMQEERETHSISSILGSEEMSKKGDSNAANALKRVTGITLVDGKSIFVRGLGERYSNVELNSMPLPSPDPTKRVVPLDIFPAGVIGSMKVQKSATADIPSNFGGGYINIRTKDQSDEDFLKFSIALKGSDKTFGDSNTYEGSSTDIFGRDDGYREIPKSITGPTDISVGDSPVSFNTGNGFTEEELMQLQRDYVSGRNFNVEEQKLPLGFNLGFSGAKNFDIDNEQRIGISGGYEYKQSHSHHEEESFSYLYDRELDQLKTDPLKYYTQYKTKSSYDHGGIFNLSYSYADIFNIKYTKLYILQSDKVTRVDDGVFGSNNYVQRYVNLNWEERELSTDQINGEINYALFNEEATFSFGGQLGEANLNQPGDYVYVYQKPATLDYYILDNETENNQYNSLESDDEITSYYLKNKQHIPALSDKDYIEVGISGFSKERISRQRTYQLNDRFGFDFDETLLGDDIDTIHNTYILDDTITYDTRYFTLDNQFEARNYFDAEVDETAFYVNTFFVPHENIEIMLGARQVQFKQTVYEYGRDTNGSLDNPTRGLYIRFPQELEVDDLYPSLNVKFIIDDDNQVDLAASRTFIVPDLREFTSGAYKHPYEVAEIVGNPDLKNTEIDNLDIKYSHYFSPTEVLRLGLFFKSLDNPIEDTEIPSSSLTRYSFVNSKKAIIKGFEIDGRKNFDFISDDLEYFYIAGNFSYTDSDVTIDRDNEAIPLANNHRQLQGLSQEVINLSLGYDDQSQSVVLVYNKMGERIRKVGLIDAGEDFYPDQYEIPPELLDLIWVTKYENGISTKIKLQNLLDSETVWEQGGRTTKKFRTGRKFEVSLSYKF